MFTRTRSVPMPDEELIDEIGQFLGFDMWNFRDKSKKYVLPGNRSDEDFDCLLADDYVEGKVITYKNIPLLLFQYKGYNSIQSLYTLNLFTLKPTKASDCQTLLSKELIDKIKASRGAIFV